jgi:hypothetical protein
MSGSQWLEKQEHFDWMQKCLTCWKMCEEFIAWCIENNKYVSILNTCRDASEMCSQCIKFEAQHSPFFQNLCEVCAEICELCVAEMDKFKDKNDILIQTNNSCSVFADACREVATRDRNSLLPRKDNLFNTGQSSQENI